MTSLEERRFQRSLGLDRNEQQYIIKIEWASQRQLTTLALLLATGIGAFEVLERVKI